MRSAVHRHAKVPDPLGCPSHGLLDSSPEAARAPAATPPQAGPITSPHRTAATPFIQADSDEAESWRLGIPKMLCHGTHQPDRPLECPAGGRLPGRLPCETDPCNKTCEPDAAPDGSSQADARRPRATELRLRLINLAAITWVC